jgi:hypothetical protein
VASPDDVFGDGARLGGELCDFVVKARLRVQRREHPLLPARDLVARLEHAYDECVDGVLAEVERVLNSTDSRKSVPLRLVEPEQGDDLFKAALDVAKLRRQGQDPTDKGAPFSHTGRSKQPVRNVSGQQRARRGTANLREYNRPHGGVGAPGARGGKWYRDKQGNIRYGEPPKGQTYRPIHDDEVREHLKAYRPAPAGRGMPEVEIVAQVRRRGKEYGFTVEEAKFLESWFGSESPGGGWDGGDLQEAFKRETGAAGVPEGEEGGGAPAAEAPEETMVHWLAAQDWGTSEAPTAEDQQDYFHTDVKPILDDLFGRFADLRESPELEKKAQPAVKGNPRRRFSAAMTKHAAFVDRAVRSITGGTDRGKVGAEVVAALAAVGVLEVSGGAPPCGGYHDGARAGAAAPSAELLGDGDESIANKAEEMADWPLPGIVLMAVASRLAAAWDQDAASYAVDSATQDSGLASSTKQLIQSRLGEIPSGLVLDQVDEVARRLCGELSAANHGADPKMLDLARRAQSGDPSETVEACLPEMRKWRDSHATQESTSQDWLDLASRAFERRVETMYGRPADLFAALDAVAPGHVGTRAEFVSRFQRRQWDPETGECVETNPEDLRGMRERVKVAVMHVEDGER